MPAKSLNLDVDVLAWIGETARSEGKSESAVVNEVLRVCIDQEKVDRGRRRGRKI